jgi:hypothetical protein
MLNYRETTVFSFQSRSKRRNSHDSYLVTAAGFWVLLLSRPPMTAVFKWVQVSTEGGGGGIVEKMLDTIRSVVNRCNDVSDAWRETVFIFRPPHVLLFHRPPERTGREREGAGWKREETGWKREGAGWEREGTGRKRAWTDRERGWGRDIHIRCKALLHKALLLHKAFLLQKALLLHKTLFLYKIVFIVIRPPRVVVLL